MRVVLHALTNLLLGDVLSPYAGIGDEEALVGREAVLHLQRFLRRGVLVSIPCHLQTTVVGEVLAQRQSAVAVQARQHLDGREEAVVEVGALVEAGCVAGCPPVVHVACGIKLATLIVESVCHLVSDDHADGSIVECLVGLRVEERILQDASGEANLVGRGVIVGVHGLRCHVPLVLVDGLASLLVDVLLVAPHAHGHHILVVRLCGIDGELRIVSPLVGITNLHVEGIQLLVGVLLRGVAHPLLSIDALAQGNLQIAHQRLHLLLRRGGEVALAVHLAQSLTHGALHGVGGATPQRVVLLATRHRATEEIEVSLANLVAQHAGSTHDDVPLHVGTQVVGGHGGEQFVHALHELRLTHNHLLQVLALHALGISHLLERNVRAEGFQLLQRHLVVVGLRVAQLGAALRNQRHRCLEAEHGVALGLGLCLREAEELEHAGDVLLVGLANLHRGLIVIQIVVFLSEGETALRDVQDVHLHILLVGTEARAEGHAVAHRGILQLQLLQVLLRAGSLHLVEQRLHRCDALIVAAHRVHGQLVEVGELAFRGAVGKLFLLQVAQDGVDALVVVFLQLVEAAEARVGGGQRIQLLPTTGCKHVEVLGGLHVLVKILHAEARLVLSHACYGQRQHQSHRNHLFHFHDGKKYLLCSINFVCKGKKKRAFNQMNACLF